MERLELIQKIEKLEKRKTIFKNLFDDTYNAYSKDVCFMAQMQGLYDYRRNYNGQMVEVDEKLFIEYLEKEISQLNTQIIQLINQLKGDELNE